MATCGFCGLSPAYIDHGCAEQDGPRRLQNLVTIQFPQDVILNMYSATREVFGADHPVVAAVDQAMFRNTVVVDENKVPSI